MRLHVRDAMSTREAGVVLVGGAVVLVAAGAVTMTAVAAGLP